MRKRRWLVTYTVAKAQIIEADSAEAAARQLRAREPRSRNLVVFDQSDHNGDNPIPINLPED